MYIPTWLLIIIILGICFYYFSKQKKTVQTNIQTKQTETEDVDWFEAENWRDIMLGHLSKYPQRTGKKSPTYEEMLKLDKDEFKSWLFVRSTPEFQDAIIKEMIEHEDKTNSFAKTSTKEDGPFTKLIIDVFNRDRSAEVVDILRRMSDTANTLIDEGAEGEKGDSVKNAILAKATSDYFKLSERS